MEKLKLKTKKERKLNLPMGVLAIAVDEPRDQVICACMDGVYALRLSDGSNQRLYEHESYASGVKLHPTQPIVVSAGYDGQLIWYDLQQQQLFRRVQAHDFWSWQMAMSPDGSLVASVTGQYLAGSERYDPAAEQEPSVKVFEVATGRLVHQLSHTPSVQSVAFSRDGQQLAAANLMGNIRIWDSTSGQLLKDWTTDAFTSWGIIKSHCYIGGINALAFSPDGQSLLGAGMGPMRDPMAGNGRQLWQRFAWQNENPELLDETHEGESGEGLMETLAYHPANNLFLMGGRLRGGEWNAALFAEADGRRLSTMNTGFRMTDAEFSADGQTLYLAGCDKQHGPKKGEYPSFGRVELRSLTGLEIATGNDA